MRQPTFPLNVCHRLKESGQLMTRSYFKMYSVLLCFIFATVSIKAQWSSNEPQSLQAGLYPNIVSDGAGGQIIASYTPSTINIIKLNSDGIGQWGAGVGPFVMRPQVPVSMTTDGAGGVIIAWTAFDDSYNIYAQRINTNGETVWTLPRATVCTGEGDQVKPTIVSDGEGGAVICWYDHRNEGKGIYAQRLNAAGETQWATDGVEVTPSTNGPENENDFGPAMVSNGAGEVALTWTQEVSGSTHIYTQRLNAAGARVWPVAGVKLTTSAGTYPFIVNDASGGNIVVWKSSGVRAQRINASGIVQWTAGGKTVSSANGRPFVTNDESGGAFITWISSGLRAQRINDQGTNQWAQEVVLCPNSYQPTPPSVIRDGAGGCIISWQDFRTNINEQVFAQRINGSGAIQWQASGVSLYPLLLTQLNPVISTNGAQGAVVAWNNSPGINGGGTFAQNLNANGTIGSPQTFPPCHWTGAMNSAWENSGNWSGGIIPGIGSDVIIDNGSTVIINSNVTVRTLKVMPSSNLTLSPGRVLKILH